MAARKRRVTLNEKWRDKIRASMLVNRLQGCALGEVEMTDVQVKAANILLRKVAPDLQSVEHMGEGGGPVQVAFNVKLDGR